MRMLLFQLNPLLSPACSPCGPHTFLSKEKQRLYCCLLLNFFLPICQRTFRLCCTPGSGGLGRFQGSITLGGEYRSRTDDLLRARQALEPAELIPLLRAVPSRLELRNPTLSGSGPTQLRY